MKLRIISRALFVLAFVGLSGCAAFEQKQIPRVEVPLEQSQFENKPSIYVDLSFHHGELYGKSNEVPNAKETVLPIVSSAIEKTGLFSTYTFDGSEADTADYTIKIEIYNHGNYGLAAASGFISGFTFGVIPGAGKDNYTVFLEARDASGKFLSSNTNSDAIKTWIGIWFIPVMGHTPQKALHNTLENQVITALVDLMNKQVLEYSSIGGQPFVG